MSRRNNKQLKVVFLGGVGEIGKNMTAIEYGDNILIVDCGGMFATYETPGVDLITPDFSYIDENADKVKGVVLTHGHEDHIGGLPYLVKDRLDKVKIYGSDKEVVYDPQKRIGVTISKLGASRAISVGAYAFALSQLDAQNNA